MEGNRWFLHVDFNGVFHTAGRPECDPMVYFHSDVTEEEKWETERYFLGIWPFAFDFIPERK